MEGILVPQTPTPAGVLSSAGQGAWPPTQWSAWDVEHDLPTGMVQ